MTMRAAPATERPTRRVRTAAPAGTPVPAGSAPDSSPVPPPAKGAGRVRLHRHEADRVASLLSYGVLDTAPAECFDGLTRLAAQLCATPIAVISLIDTDRQWNLSGHGVADTGVPRWESICSDAVASGAPLVITDLRGLPRYTDLPGVVASDGIRAYAGIPLIGRDGLPLGALCVLDRVPRVFTAPELRGLRDLAEQVVHVLELHRADGQSGLHSPGLVPDAREPTVLRKALDDGEFTPFFQPLVDLHTGTTIGLEALIRWTHPTHGVLPPAAFLAGLETGTLADWTSRGDARSGLRADRRPRHPRGGPARRDRGQRVRPAAGQPPRRPGAAPDPRPPRPGRDRGDRGDHRRRRGRRTWPPSAAACGPSAGPGSGSSPMTSGSAGPTSPGCCSCP